MTEKRKAGQLGLKDVHPSCICDPMDLAAMGHMTNCPATEWKDCPSGRGWCNLATCKSVGCMDGLGFFS